MKQNFKKKAFTLVELLVVIAIIAVLASVSVVGYMHFIDKAHDSNDITLVKQLNTVLSSSSVTTKNNETMCEAVEDLASSSITVDQLSSEKNEILWDQDSDRFLVLKGEKIIYKDEATNANIVATPHKLWKVYNEIPETQNYSIYLNQKEESVSLYAEPQVDFTLTTGFDAGNVSTAFNLTYTGLAAKEENTIINMNKGTLTINDNKADLNIMGNAVDLIIKDSFLTKIYSTIENRVELYMGNVLVKKESDFAKLLIASSSFGEGKESNIIFEDDTNKKINDLKIYDEKIINSLNGIFDVVPEYELDLSTNYQFYYKIIKASNGYGLDRVDLLLDIDKQKNLTYKYHFELKEKGELLAKTYDNIFENVSDKNGLTKMDSLIIEASRDPVFDSFDKFKIDIYGKAHNRPDFFGDNYNFSVNPNSKNKVRLVIESEFAFTLKNCKIEAHIDVYSNINCNDNSYLGKKIIHLN